MKIELITRVTDLRDERVRHHSRTCREKDSFSEKKITKNISLDKRQRKKYEL